MDSPTRVGLIGWPVAHSVSPAMHNAAFQTIGLNWQYDSLPIPPEQLTQEFGRLLDTGYRGFNVTIPYKQDLLAAVGRIRLDEAVVSIGAANTITVASNGGLWATNTDWKGFCDDLKANGVAVESADCLILGTGGSARAAAYGLRQMGAASVTFASRNSSFRPDITSYEEAAKKDPSFDLIINCTPAGMHPHVGESPWPGGIAFPADVVLYDLVYNPAETTLMRQARAAGARAIGGLGMLVRQGALSFELWTGFEAPLDVMEEAARKQLKRLARD